ncbi:hypothetical protein [Stappia sp.]|uniref:hypothetical protein n=1 Tax=Stappia sp. TaxID=1870903 RepID=UPI003A9992FA
MARRCPAPIRSALLLVAAAVTGASPALADPVDPVAEVMQVTEGNWADDGTPYEEIFTDERLQRLFSADFVARYRAASAFPAYDGSTSPFGYDVIVNAQDGCPLQGLAIKAGRAAAGRTLVTARFVFTACFGDAPEFRQVSEVRFEVVKESGRDVIDDILTGSDADGYASLKAELDTIARQ